MKFINYLESITGIGLFPLISLFIFLLFFLGVAIYVIRADKKYIDKVKQLPFSDKH